MSRTALIDWSHIDRPGFDRVVEALLQRIHEKEPGVTVQVFDGRGGDEGRDVVVYRDGAVDTIYQLKCFPEGFSGGHVKRRQQVKKSFTRAMDHKPVRWVLVILTNPTTDEKHFVNSLKGKSAVEVSVMGRAALDSALAAHTDLLDAFTRDPLVETLKEIGQEARGLVKPEHLDATLGDLHRRTDGRSAYWGIEFSVGPHGTVQKLYAKHPDAATLEPIHVNFTAASDRLDAGARARLKALFDYGAGGGSTIVIPSEAVVAFEVTGPEWIATQSEGGQVEITALAPEAVHAVELRLMRDNGTTITALRGRSTEKGVGKKGVSLRAAFPGGLDLEFYFPTDAASAGEVKFQHELVGEDAIAVDRTLKFEGLMDAPQTLEVWIDGLQLAKLRSAGGVNRPGRSDQIELLAEDLAVIAVELDVPLVIPAELSATERAEIRSLRLLLDGYCVLVPEIARLDLTLGGGTDSTLEEFISDAARMVRVDSGLKYKIQGHELAVPDAVLFHPTVRPSDPDTVLAALHAGTVEGMSLRLEPTDGTPFRAVIPGKVHDQDVPLVPVPLGVPGLTEPDAIRKIGETAAIPRTLTSDAPGN